jgi:multicomponent Na+:H+ antiporter subunit B
LTPLLVWITRALAPAMAVTAAAMAARGHAQPGDGFSAGIVAGTAVAVSLLVFGRAEAARTVPLSRGPVFGVGGVLVLSAVVWAPALLGRAPLTHWPGLDVAAPHVGQVPVSTATAFELGMALTTFGFFLTTLDLLSLWLELDEEVP